MSGRPEAAATQGIPLGDPPGSRLFPFPVATALPVPALLWPPAEVCSWPRDLVRADLRARARHPGCGSQTWPEAPGEAPRARGIELRTLAETVPACAASPFTRGAACVMQQWVASWDQPAKAVCVCMAGWLKIVFTILNVNMKCNLW